MDEKIVELVKELTTLIGPSGYEYRVTNYIVDKVKKYCDSYEIDNSGNALFYFKSKVKDPKKLIFAAHTDEVGFMIFDITDDGFIYLMPIGGWNTLTLPSSIINFVNDDDKIIEGVIGQISPHFLRKDAKQEIPTFDDLFVDIGAKSREEVENVYKLHLGSIATPKSEFKYDKASSKALAKAFDDRIGCAAQILLAQSIDKSKLKYDVTLAFTVQEEVGHRGASVVSNNSCYDYAIIIEGAPADDIPSGPRHPQTRVGHGCHVRIFDPTHIANYSLVKQIQEISKENNIKTQFAVRKGGGTDAASLALSGKGVKTIITGVPTRYAHSHNSVISLDDLVENVKLCKAFIEK